MSESKTIPGNLPAAESFSRGANGEEPSGSPLPESSVDETGRVLRRSPEEIARRNRAAMLALQEIEEIGDEDDHRETMAILRRALGEGRTISNRKLF